MPDNDADKPQRAESDMSPAAKRALAEARARQAGVSPDKADDNQGSETERGGPKGPEPTRYGDWERKGISTDF